MINKPIILLYWKVVIFMIKGKEKSWVKETNICNFIPTENAHEDKVNSSSNLEHTKS